MDKLGAGIAKIETELILFNDWDTGRSGGRYTLYPKWGVQLFFDKDYENIDGYYVALWADTGEIFHAQPQGHYGQTTPQESSFDSRPWIAIITISALLAVIIVVYKKRSSALQNPAAKRKRQSLKRL